jgi:hypothetical protein
MQRRLHSANGCSRNLRKNIQIKKDLFFKFLPSSSDTFLMIQNIIMNVKKYEFFDCLKSYGGDNEEFQ